ncbi:unnamed protein product [Phaeothamnion confervicola]
MTRRFPNMSISAGRTRIAEKSSGRPSKRITRSNRAPRAMTSSKSSIDLSLPVEDISRNIVRAKFNKLRCDMDTHGRHNWIGSSRPLANPLADKVLPGAALNLKCQRWTPFHRYARGADVTALADDDGTPGVRSRRREAVAMAALAATAAAAAARAAAVFEALAVAKTAGATHWRLQDLWAQRGGGGDDGEGGRGGGGRGRNHRDI